MIVKSQFKIDRFQLKYSALPGRLLDQTAAATARTMGEDLIKAFPYVKNEEASFHGELPEMSLNKDHQYFDLYESEFVVLTMEEYKNLLK